MNITVNSNLLAQELRILNKVVSEKPSIPVLSHVLLTVEPFENILRMTTTDLEAGIKTTCPAVVTETGSIIVPAKTLLDLVENTPNTDLTIYIERGQIRVKTATFNARIQAMPVEDYPNIPEVEEEMIPLPSIGSLINKTRYAISEKEQRHLLKGSLLSMRGTSVVLVSTDGKRIAMASAVGAAEYNLSLILPEYALDMVAGLSGDVLFSYSEKNLFFTAEHRVFFFRRFEGQFPNYERAIPRDYTAEALFSRIDLLSAVRRMSVIALGGSISLALAPGTAKLSALSVERGESEESINAVYDGVDVLLTLNWSYLIDFLAAADNDQITLSFKDAASAVLLTDGDSFLNVMMTMR